jgi:hypothetical protein
MVFFSEMMVIAGVALLIIAQNAPQVIPALNVNLDSNYLLDIATYPVITENIGI